MMTPDQPDQNTHAQPDEGRPQPPPGAYLSQPDAAQHSEGEGTVIPFPSLAGVQMQRAPEVLEGELVGEPECVRRPMPVVLPPWLRSRETARATLRWAAEYAARHV
ncbi:MAG: hypothetical protein JO063_07785, partial [Pseudonocardiales bacterium]|nr:hypothetical protein [Pseudonocardiales bacterium]